MKFCRRCGASMNDEDLFCSKCGHKDIETVEEIVTPEIPKEQEVVAPIKVEEKKGPIKGIASLHEQSLKEILPVPLALIVCSIILWVINAVGNLSGIGKIFPLIIFMFISGFLAALSMIRAVKTLNRKIYFKAALSFVLFALLVTCLIIDFVFLVNS